MCMSHQKQVPPDSHMYDLMGIKPHIQSIKDKDDGDDNETTSTMMRCSGVERESRWHQGEVERASRDDELSYMMPD